MRRDKLKITQKILHRWGNHTPPWTTNAYETIGQTFDSTGRRARLQPTAPAGSNNASRRAGFWQTAVGSNRAGGKGLDTNSIFSVSLP